MLSEEETETRRLALEAELGEAVTVDGLSAAWRIFQRRRGHRHSTDDLLTAWYALEKGPPASLCLDLGTGIGTVGLLVLEGLAPSAHLVCVEAQDISWRFLQENLALNGVASRVSAHHGDLRSLALDERFPLVTGSPPYFDPGAGIIPSDSQKAHARFELRGDVRDYAKAAKRHLADDGTFVYCFPFQQRQRAVDAAHEEGFSILFARDVIPRTGLAPLFSLFACKLGAHPEVLEPPFVVRHADGAHAPDLVAVRRRFGWV